MTNRDLFPYIPGMKLLTPAQVAERLGVSERSVYVLIGNGHIESVDVGAGTKRTRLRVTDAEVDRFITARTLPRTA